MIYETIEWFTLLFLIVFYFSVEIYQARKRQRGRILSFYDLPLRKLFGARVRVEMENGKIVDADISGCDLCVGRFEVGDRVYISKRKDGYIVSLPLLARTKQKRDKCCSLVEGKT